MSNVLYNVLIICWYYISLTVVTVYYEISMKMGLATCALIETCVDKAKVLPVDQPGTCEAGEQLVIRLLYVFRVCLVVYLCICNYHVCITSYVTMQLQPTYSRF